MYAKMNLYFCEMRFCQHIFRSLTNFSQESVRETWYPLGMIFFSIKCNAKISIKLQIENLIKNIHTFALKNIIISHYIFLRIYFIFQGHWTFCFKIISTRKNNNSNNYTKWKKVRAWINTLVLWTWHNFYFFFGFLSFQQPLFTFLQFSIFLFLIFLYNSRSEDKTYNLKKNSTNQRITSYLIFFFKK